MKKALIIGGGIAGCAAAHQLTLQGGWDISLVEKGPNIGAWVPVGPKKDESLPKNNELAHPGLRWRESCF